MTTGGIKGWVMDPYAVGNEIWVPDNLFINNDPAKGFSCYGYLLREIDNVVRIGDTR